MINERSPLSTDPPSFTAEVSDFLGYTGEELLRITGYTHEFVPAPGAGVAATGAKPAQGNAAGPRWLAPSEPLP
jgi:hypothetical protein